MFLINSKLMIILFELMYDGFVITKVIKSLCFILIPNY